MGPFKAFVAAFALVLAPSVLAHSGGLDSLGCHHNRKAGGYRCHQGPLAGRAFASKADAQDALAALEKKTGANSGVSRAEADQRGNPSTRVWVNTNSGVYHCPGTRWYGATKAGEYMSQKDAQQKGHRPAYGKYCQ
jgi:hypothetical protein